MLLGKLLVLLLPLVALLLNRRDLALKVLGLDIGLAQLLGGLTQVLFRCLELLLENGNLLGERLVRRAMGSALLGGTLGLLELLLKSLDLLLEKSVLVGQRSNLLLLLQVVVLELLDLLVGLVGALLGRLGLSLEGVEFLSLAFGFTMGVYCHAMT